MAKASIREQQREATIEAIKAAARAHMKAEGTAAISLRAIARALDVTAPALYRYFTNRDDLITDLLLDAFNGMADAVVAAAAAQPRAAYAERLIAVTMEYRAWALQNPLDFQLIYGNPIPGYVAPPEITVPAARRPFDLVVGILSEALAAGALKPPMTVEQLPPSVTAFLQNLIGTDGYPELPIVLYISVVGWTRIHGMVMLELFENTQAVVGDTEAFYRHEVTRLCAEMSLFPKS
ncbi:MAG: TetR/AcrR family transcriptional regulator [Chloroflexota bacterium]